MSCLIFLTHPEVVIDPDVPVQNWSLSDNGKNLLYKSLRRGALPQIDHVFSSPERKAMDASAIIRNHFNCDVTILDKFGELDRSSTGYLPEDQHHTISSLAFEYPGVSIQGWERVDDMKDRIIRCFHKIEASIENGATVLASGHGGSGFALYLYLQGLSNYDRKLSPPSMGSIFSYSPAKQTIELEWTRLDDVKPSDW